MRALYARASVADSAALNAALMTPLAEPVARTLGGGYVQLGYNLLSQRTSTYALTPYYRFERIDIESADAVFQGVPNLEGSTLGVRYDLSMYAAVKGEFRSWRRTPGSPRNYGGFFQICFTF